MVPLSQIKLLFFILVSFPQFIFAQTEEKMPIDLLAICMDGPIEHSLIIVDDGFCEHFLEKESESLTKEAFLKINDGTNLNPDLCLTEKDLQSKDKWKIRLYASHSYTTYFNSDITFKTSRYNVEVKDYQWAERSSREFFEPQTWKEDGHNPFQWIDEPSNTFTVSIEKNGNEFFLSAFHPKFFQGTDQQKYMKGTIDGVPVDGVQNVNEPYDGYNQRPGESEIMRNENTHRQMTFEVGYGYRFKLLSTKFGSLSYIPSVAGGVMVGQNYSSVIQEGKWWDNDSYQDSFGVQGFGGSITNRIELNSPQERIGVFYENKLSLYKQGHGFQDGSQKYNLSYMGNSFGVQFMIYNPKNHKKKNSVTNTP
jgi:hypothetical protein